MRAWALCTITLFLSISTTSAQSNGTPDALDEALAKVGLQREDLGWRLDLQCAEGDCGLGIDQVCLHDLAIRRDESRRLDATQLLANAWPGCLARKFNDPLEQ